MRNTSDAEELRVEQVMNRRDLGQFIELPFELYRHDPCWVPPLRSERRRFLTQKHNPFFDHADVALWLARRGGKVVGRVSSQIDRLHNQVHGERLAMFGFFECERSPETAAALLNAAALWSRQRGAEALRGPLSFSMNHESGLLIEGSDEPPVVGMPHNPPWYQELIEQWGLAKEKDLLAAQAAVGERFAGAQDLPEDLLKVAEGVKSLVGVKIRFGRRADRSADIERIVKVYNQAWTGNWGFVPLTPAEGRALTRDLDPTIDSALTVMAEVEGEPVGVCMGIRDMNEVLKHLGGRLFPFGWLTALRRTGSIRATRVILFGVIEAYQGLGVGALLFVEAVKAALAAGYQRVELGWILETNQGVLGPLLALGEPLGVRVHRRYRIYKRRL